MNTVSKSIGMLVFFFSVLPLRGHMENACLLFLAKGQVCFRKSAFLLSVCKDKPS